MQCIPSRQCSDERNQLSILQRGIRDMLSYPRIRDIADILFNRHPLVDVLLVVELNLEPVGHGVDVVFQVVERVESGPCRNVSVADNLGSGKPLL